MDVGKLVGYGVVGPKGTEVSKAIGYGVVGPEGAEVSKALAYSVVGPERAMVSKLLAYAVVEEIPPEPEPVVAPPGLRLANLSLSGVRIRGG